MSKNNRISKAGRLIKKKAEQQHIPYEYLADIMGLYLFELEEIISGDRPMTEEIAESLQFGLGVAKDIWMKFIS